MDEAKRKVIRRLRPELEVQLVLRHLESLLHVEAGGFLTDRELQQVTADEVNYKQVRKLLDILLEKSNNAFMRFCRILNGREINKGELALRLMEGAGMKFPISEEELDFPLDSASPPPDRLSTSPVSKHVEVAPKLVKVVDEFVSTLMKLTTLFTKKTEDSGSKFEELKVALSARLQMDYFPNGPPVEKVDKAAGVSELFSLFKVSNNWVDTDRLEQLVEYSKCEPARTHMEEYKKFLAQNITDCFAALVSPMVNGIEPQPDGASGKVQFVFSDDFERKHLCELLMFKKRLIERFRIKKEWIDFVSACLGGSLITTWLVALFIGWIIWYKLQDPPVLQFLQTEGVVEVRFICRNIILKKTLHSYRQEADSGESDQLSTAVDDDPLLACLTHEGETLDLFCANPFCNMPVCCKCAEESHRTHTTVPFAQVDEERLAEVIKGHVDTMSANCDYFQRVAREERDRKPLIDRDETEALAQVRIWEDKMIKAIRERGEALRKDIKDAARERKQLSTKKMMESADLLMQLDEAKMMGRKLTSRRVTKVEVLSSASTISSQLIKMNAKCAISKMTAVSAPLGFADDEQELLKSSLSSSGCVTAGPHPLNTKVDVNFPCRMLYHPGMEFILKVTVHDENNRRCRDGGDCVTGYLYPLATPGPPIKARVKNNSDGSYTVLFSKLYLGECKVDIMVNGQPISNELARLRIIEEDKTPQHAVASELHFPERPSFLRGIAISKDGVLCVSDRERHTIHIFDAHLKHTRCIRNKGDKEGQLKSPRNLAFSKDGELIVACTDRIDVLTLDGQFVRRFGFKGEEKVSDACDIAVRGNGQVYIADYGNDRIAVYEEDGRFLYSIGEQGTGPGKLTGPKGVAFYKDEKLVVSDHGNNRLQVFTPEGVYISGFGSYGIGKGQFNHPLSLAVTNEGYILVPEYNNNRVSIHTLTGKSLLTWNGDESPRGPFNRPTAIALRDKRECFVVETTGVHLLTLPEISDEGIIHSSH